MKIYCLHCKHNLGPPTVFYANQTLARKALCEKRDKYDGRNYPVNLIKDTEDIFAFFSIVDGRVAWKVREINVVES